MVVVNTGIKGIVFLNATASGEQAEKLLIGVYAIVVTVAVLVALTSLYRLR